MIDHGDAVPYQEKKMKITIVGTDASGKKHTIGEISFDMAEYVGSM